MAEGVEGNNSANNENRLLGKIREFTQSKVNESRLPTKESLGYESTVGVYGGKLVEKDGKLIYKTTGLLSNIDRMGDWVLRTYDEHIMSDPAAILRRHPLMFLRGFIPGPLRYRGNPQEIAENARRLGLGDIYGLDSEGIEIKKPSVLKSGYVLQDIYRQDQIGNEILNSLDRTIALAEAGKYIRSIHDRYGAIGELLVSDIIFQSIKDGKPQEPILNLPDELYNPKKIISENAKKATDILDLLASISFEELRRSSSLDEIKTAIDSILINYGDSEVIKTVESFAKRGRLVMAGEKTSATEKGKAFFELHNKSRLSIKEEATIQIRQLIIDSCASATEI